MDTSTHPTRLPSNRNQIFSSFRVSPPPPPLPFFPRVNPVQSLAPHFFFFILCSDLFSRHPEFQVDVLLIWKSSFFPGKYQIIRSPSFAKTEVTERRLHQKVFRSCSPTKKLISLLSVLSRANDGCPSPSLRPLIADCKTSSLRSTDSLALNKEGLPLRDKYFSQVFPPVLTSRSRVVV